jgi:hypothetical protein
MSWAAFGTALQKFTSSKWFREQSPIVALAFCSLLIASYYVFHAQPEERRENRETWKQLRSDIQDGHQRIEDQQTRQIDRISSEFRQTRTEDVQLIQSLLRGKVSKEALTDASGNLSSVSPEPECDEGP